MFWWLSRVDRACPQVHLSRQFQNPDSGSNPLPGVLLTTAIENENRKVNDRTDPRLSFYRCCIPAPFRRNTGQPMESLSDESAGEVAHDDRLPGGGESKQFAVNAAAPQQTMTG